MLKEHLGRQPNKFTMNSINREYQSSCSAGSSKQYGEHAFLDLLSIIGLFGCYRLSRYMQGKGVPYGLFVCGSATGRSL